MMKVEEKQIPISEELIALADQNWKDLNLFSQRYFSTLSQKQMPLGAFLRSQEAFFFAVRCFSRSLSILASRIEVPKARLKLVENIYEEHGEMDLDASHEATFKTWLSRLNGGKKYCSVYLNLLPCVDAFNLTLFGACQFEVVEKGLACLGTIEYMFSFISKFIAESVVTNGWLREEELIHYNLHADLDIQHSKDLFDALDKIKGANLDKAKEGVALGVFIFSRLYQDLYEATVC